MLGSMNVGVHWVFTSLNSIVNKNIIAIILILSAAILLFTVLFFTYYI